MLNALASLLLLAGAPREARLSHPLTPVDSLIRPGEVHFAHLWRTGGVCPRWRPDGAELAVEALGKVWVMPAFERDYFQPQSEGFATSPGYIRDEAVVYAGGDSSGTMAGRWHDPKWSLVPGSQIYVHSFMSMESSPLTRDPAALECNTSPDGKQIIYTATPATDPELYVMNADGSNVRRLTADYGYDGSGCFSPDGQLICYQAYHPRLEDEKAIYADLLSKHLVDSSLLDIWMMHADGSGRGQVTDLGATSMEPSFTPDSKRIIFSSDYLDVQGRQFDLYITKFDGGSPERVTNDPSPDCFPMFSPNGRYLAFTSGRGSSTAGAQNVFIAEWKE